MALAGRMGANNSSGSSSPRPVVYVGVGSGPLRDRVTAAGHGQMVSRDAFRVPNCRWTFDNGAFTDWKNGQPFDESKFWKRLEQIVALDPCEHPEWAVCPDRVAHPQSLSYSSAWRGRLPESIRWYLALQDGMEPRSVEAVIRSGRFAGLFVGGSSDWKNQRACEWVAFGHAHGLPVHVGRVNGWKRLQWCVDIDADSIDGTGWTRDPRWIAYLEEMPTKSRMIWDS